VHSTPPIITSAVDCPVLALARVYDELARQYLDADDPKGTPMDDATASDLTSAIADRMNEISEAASYLSPRTFTGVAFQIMLAHDEIDLTLGSANTPHQEKAAKAKVDRLLYRSLDLIRAEANELQHARAYIMSVELDPARAGLRKDEEDRTDA
jgi:hypothetical protein